MNFGTINNSLNSVPHFAHCIVGWCNNKFLCVWEASRHSVIRWRPGSQWRHLHSLQSPVSPSRTSPSALNHQPWYLLYTICNIQHQRLWLLHYVWQIILFSHARKQATNHQGHFAVENHATDHCCFEVDRKVGHRWCFIVIFQKVGLKLKQSIHTLK